jgi:hypothetical protein
VCRRRRHGPSFRLSECSSTLLTAVKPPISTIHCKTLNNFSKVCYSLSCISNPIPANLLVPTFRVAFRRVSIAGPPVPPEFRIPFQVPYPLSPAFATLAKTAGVGTNNSHFGSRSLRFNVPTFQRSDRLTIPQPIPFPFTPLRTLLHRRNLNSFLFNRFRTLCAKTPGVGVA